MCPKIRCDVFGKKIVGTKQGLISQLLTFMSCHDISFFTVNEQIAEKHPVLTC